jgi:DNA-binding transcriptional MerR regulator
LGKSAEAFRTISEVSVELDVPKHVLRFWETKFAQVKPMKRGGNRRYYRPEDVELLRGIRTLLHDEGYTIRGLQRVLRQQGVNYVKTYRRSEASPSGALPDLAGETAGHARKVAMERAKAKPKHEGRSAGAQPGRSATANKPSNNRALTSAQRQTLQAAINELEQCRQLLSSASGSAP